MTRARRAAAQGARNAAAGAAVLALAATAVAVSGPVVSPSPSPAPASACPAGQHPAQDGIGLPECER